MCVMKKCFLLFHFPFLLFLAKKKILGYEKVKAVLFLCLSAGI